MKTRDVGLCLVGGFAVYVAMAACAASESAPGGTVAGTTSGTGSGGGHGGAGWAGGSGGLAQGGAGQAGQSGEGGALGAGGVSGGSGVGGTGAPDDGGIFDALTDPVPVANADPTSGSRLKAKYRTGEDGSKAYIPYVWYDSQRQEDCQYLRAADGKDRCMPVGTPSPLITEGWFADAACTAAVVLAGDACALPKSGYKFAAGSCATEPAYQVFEVGAPLTPTPSTLYYKSGANCTGAAPGPGFVYLPVGNEIPASAFVASTVGTDP